MSADYIVTVELLGEKTPNGYETKTTVYEQRASDLDLWAVIRAVNSKENA